MPIRDARPIQIRLLGADDLTEAVTLSSTAGWNQRTEDWRLMLQVAPAGSFGAVHEGSIVGTAIGIDYGTFSWIAMMLVDPAFRGQGIGRRLLEAAMDAVPIDKPIRLDATPMGRPLYEACGFLDEVPLTRHAAAAHERMAAESATPVFSNVRPMTASDLPAIARLDRVAFRVERRHVLEWVLERAPEYCQVLVEEREIAGYCFGRHGRLFDQIGPIVAPGEVAAKNLAAAALNAAGGRALIVDAFDASTRFTEWLRTRGFLPQRPLFRMQRPPAGGTPVMNDADHSMSTVAILGPDLA